VNKVTPLDQIAEQIGDLASKTRQHLRSRLIGLDHAIDKSLIALLSGSHALLEGVPGTAKTTLCRALAEVLGLEYRRIQFTPDLLPSDVTGTKIFDQTTGRFNMQKGPIFCQFLLADELNRAPARTQSALLEAMQERQVTIEGDTMPLPQPFIVLATQNPVEQEGVYRLPEAQLDRFLFRIQIGYPDREGELDLLDLQEKPVQALDQIWNMDGVLDFQSYVDDVYGAPELKQYVVDLIRASRNHEDILLGASPRAAIFLLRAARTNALINSRTFFTHEDVQDMAQSVMEHRLIVRPEAELSGRMITEIIQEIIRSVPVRESKW
jgi:MoxR-like ATPase